MRILITGGLGFIGSHVVEQALADGYEVRVLDRRSVAEVAIAPDCADVATLMRGVDVQTGDVRDELALDRSLRDCDVVVHLAAKVGLGSGVADAPDYVSNNDVGTATLAARAAAADISRIIQASSMVVYGAGLGVCPEHGSVIPSQRTRQDLSAGRFEPGCSTCGAHLAATLIDEDDPLRPANVYAATKLSQEMLLSVWARVTDAVGVNLRFHNVYGRRLPRNTPYAGVAALFVSMLQRGEAPQVFEDGGQRRDFVHVRDVARACIAAIHAPVVAGTAQPFNVGSGTPRTVLEMAQSLARAVCGPDPVVTGDYRMGDIRHITASSQRADRHMNWRAVEDFELGMAEIAATARAD